MSLPFWTPVVLDRHITEIRNPYFEHLIGPCPTDLAFFNFIERYFAFDCLHGERNRNIIKDFRYGAVIIVRGSLSKDKAGCSTILKVIKIVSYFTVVIPLIFLIAKIIFRSYYSFEYYDANEIIVNAINKAKGEGTHGYQKLQEDQDPRHPSAQEALAPSVPLATPSAPPVVPSAPPESLLPPQLPQPPRILYGTMVPMAWNPKYDSYYACFGPCIQPSARPVPSVPPVPSLPPRLPQQPRLMPSPPVPSAGRDSFGHCAADYGYLVPDAQPTGDTSRIDASLKPSGVGFQSPYGLGFLPPYQLGSAAAAAAAAAAPANVESLMFGAAASAVQRSSTDIQAAVRQAHSDPSKPIHVALFDTLVAQTTKVISILKQQPGQFDHPYDSRLDRFSDVLSPIHTSLHVNGERINANYVGQSVTEHPFIISQAPVVGTIGRFWLAAVKNGAVIVDLLTREDQARVNRYYPETIDQTINYDGLVEVTLRNVNDRLGIRIYDVVNPITGESTIVRRLHFDGWIDFSSVTIETLNTLLRNISALEHDSGNDEEGFRPTTMIHCRAGIGRSGTLAMAMILNDMKAQGKLVRRDFTEALLDEKLLTMILTLRTQRGSGFVQNAEQFKLIREFALSLLNQ